MKNRFLKTLSVLVVAGIALTACNNTTNDDNDTNGTPAPSIDDTGDNGGDDDNDSDGKRVLKLDFFMSGNAESKGLVDAAAAFAEANPDIDVQVRVEKELETVLQKENATGSYSDVVYFNLASPSAYTESQLNSNEVLEITDVFENISDSIDPAFANSAVSNFYGDGKQYLLPFSYSPTGFFYNTELIGEGKEYEMPTTWDEMFALGDQAREDGRYLFTFPTSGYFDTVIQGMLDAAGGADFLGEAMKYAEGTWESEEGKLVLDTVAKLVSPDYLHPDTVANANAQDGHKLNQQFVIDNEALFMPNGTWIVDEMAESTPEEGFHWGLIPLPAFNDSGDRVSVSYTEQIWIPKQAANVDDAKAFLEFLFTDEGAQIMIDGGFTVPVNDVSDRVEQGYISDFLAVYEDGARASIGAYAPYDSAAMPDKDFGTIMYGTIENIANGRATVDEWQAELVDLWEATRSNPVVTD